MLIVKVMGGLGNQMFQYALGKKLEIKYNVPMFLDLSLYDRRIYSGGRSYDLNFFVLKPNILTGRRPIKHVVSEPTLKYTHEISNLFDHLNVSEDVFIDGYWQCDKYFAEIEHVIRQDFEFKDQICFGKEKILLDSIRACNSVAIHIRRTDYLNTNFHGTCGVDYVMRGVAYMLERITDAKFFIFSDDLNWCKQNLFIDNAVIVDEKLALDKSDIHFQLMTNCKHFIIANSTFSWWAAWLAHNENKIVVAPQRWFAGNVQIDIIHDAMKWIRLQND